MMFFDIRRLPDEGWMCACEGWWGRVSLTVARWQLLFSHFRDGGVGTPAGVQRFWAVSVSCHRPCVRWAKGLVDTTKVGGEGM